MKNHRGIFCIIFALCLIFMLREAAAGAREGLVESVEYETKIDLAETFREEKNYCRSFTDQCLSENVAHYYSDNRDLIKSYVPEQRMVDAVVCIMMTKGNPRFDRFKQNESFMNWCVGISAAPLLNQSLSK